MSIYVGESRGELLAWLNDLLQPSGITKVEECGKGFTYCQILDSIYGDLPMSRVKFGAKMEYEYLDNFKILQKAFKSHGVDKPIPVEKLVKCKMQDNLEFLQWLKKYWDMHSRGEGYDAAGRSGGYVPPAATTSRAPAPRARVGVSAAGVRSTSSASNAQIVELRGQVAEMQQHCETLEKERDFYFDKLRNIELIAQQRSAVEGIEEGEKETLAKIQEILYSTAEGFELPENEGLEGDDGLVAEEEETF